VTVREREDQIRRLPIENAVAWNAEGAEVLVKAGEKNRIVFTDEEMDLLKGTVFTHNHPNGLAFPDDDPRSFGNSFSIEDLRLACYAELAELRAVTPRLRFFIKPPATGWDFNYWLTIMEPAYLRHKATVARELREALVSKIVTLAQADAVYFDRICSGVSYELGLEYSREES